MKLFESVYHTEKELRIGGFKNVGKNVKIDKSCTVIGSDKISIGDNVRIDGYCCIIATKKQVVLGSYIHIGSFCHLCGTAGLVMEDFSGLSQGVRIYSSSDDYSGEFLTNPTVPEKYTSIIRKPVILSKHVIIGANTVILPGVYVGEGSAVGAMSLVTKDVKSYCIYAGCPAKFIKPRSKRIFELEKKLLDE